MGSDFAMGFGNDYDNDNDNDYRGAKRRHSQARLEGAAEHDYD